MWNKQEIYYFSINQWSLNSKRCLLDFVCLFICFEDLFSSTLFAYWFLFWVYLFSFPYVMGNLFSFPYVMGNFRKEVSYCEEPDYSYICTIPSKRCIRMLNDRWSSFLRMSCIVGGLLFRRFLELCRCHYPLDWPWDKHFSFFIASLFAFP